MIVDRRYQLVDLLGEGAFGEVWRAKDARLSGRHVAIKFLHADLLRHPEVVERFSSEADALAQAVHPNVVAVMDRGMMGDRLFIVTEFIDGVSLGTWLHQHSERNVQPDLDEVRSIFDQLCAGIEAAHAVRSPGPIIHRDIKPDNILLHTGPNGVTLVKVADFGIAQRGGRSGTRTGVQLGTPVYMAPEQAMAQWSRVGPWTDVFALGVVLVEMLTLRAQAKASELWWATVLLQKDSPTALLSGVRLQRSAELIHLCS